MPRLALSQSNPVAFNTFCGLAAFGTYFCMYAFRRPYAVGLFPGQVDLGFLGMMDYKIFLVEAQLVGYTLSKYLGVKVVSEMTSNRRALALLLLLGLAELALVGFALTPKPYSAFFLFLNGLPLGMVWGLVFSYLEGRRSTELLGVILSASYIQASGTVKAVGAWVLTLGVSEPMMPLVTGALFVPLLLVFVWMLEQIPPPSAEDIALRTERKPMPKERRRLFLKSFAPGLGALTFLYFFLTAFRSFRDDFSAELWTALGFGDEPAIFASSEIPVTLVVLISLALIMFVRENKRALLVIHAFMFGGTALVGLSTLAFEAGTLAGENWMILVGMGLYLAYVPFGCMVFDRLIASVGFVGTAGFMIYVCDAVGYAGSLSINLYKTFSAAHLSYLDFFIQFSYVTSILCCLCFAYSAYYFSTHKAHQIS